jgi:ABC-2 type transport system ATP-binding protein
MKTALLTSLAYRPELVVLDEPFSGLDPLVREELVRGILEVSRQDKWTILVSSHDINEVEQLADWVGLLDGGRLDFSEPIELLQSRFRRVEVTVGPSASVPIPTPASWMETERAGNLLRFVETRYPAADGDHALHAQFPGAEVTARPMTLREIFVVLARANRNREVLTTP